MAGDIAMDRRSFRVSAANISSATLRCRSAFRQMAFRLSVEICLSKRGVRRGETRDRQPEWRTTHIIEPDPVEEADRFRIAAMLAADSQLDIGPVLPSPVDRDLDELPDTLLIERLERILRHHTILD